MTLSFQAGWKELERTQHPIKGDELLRAKLWPKLKPDSARVAVERRHFPECNRGLGRPQDIFGNKATNRKKSKERSSWLVFQAESGNKAYDTTKTRGQWP